MGPLDLIRTILDSADCQPLLHYINQLLRDTGNLSATVPVLPHTLHPKAGGRNIIFLLLIELYNHSEGRKGSKIQTNGFGFAS